MSYARLCYASQAIKPDQLVRQDLMDIINEAVHFNAQHHIYGVLYYGNGYFFQCLEGNKEDLDYLYYQRILNDSRHQDTKLLHLDNIEQIQFSSWNMKFAPYHQGIRDFMQQYGKTEFDPFILSKDNLNQFLDLLFAA